MSKEEHIYSSYPISGLVVRARVSGISKSQLYYLTHLGYQLVRDLNKENPKLVQEFLKMEESTVNRWVSKPFVHPKPGVDKKQVVSIKRAQAVRLVHLYRLYRLYSSAEYQHLHDSRHTTASVDPLSGAEIYSDADISNMANLRFNPPEDVSGVKDILDMMQYMLDIWGSDGLDDLTTKRIYKTGQEATTPATTTREVARFEVAFHNMTYDAKVLIPPLELDKGEIPPLPSFKEEEPEEVPELKEQSSIDFSQVQSIGLGTNIMYVVPPNVYDRLMEIYEARDDNVEILTEKLRDLEDKVTEFFSSIEGSLENQKGIVGSYRKMILNKEENNGA